MHEISNDNPIINIIPKIPLQVTQWISSCRQYVIFNIHPESHHQVKNNWWAHRQQRNIDEMFADSSGGDAHFISEVGADTKHVPLDKMFKPVHIAKL